MLYFILGAICGFMFTIGSVVIALLLFRYQEKNKVIEKAMNADNFLSGKKLRAEILRPSMDEQIEQMEKNS